MKRTLLTLIISILILTSCNNDSTSPGEDKIKTVEIGKQTWMLRNLDVAVYRNGDSIFHAKTAEEWAQAGRDKKGAWCYYNHDPALGAIYGKLYNWFAVNDPRGLAPRGWRVSSLADWLYIEELVGSAYGVYMAGRVDLWKPHENLNTPNFGELGWEGYPGGYCREPGNFMALTEEGHWWTTDDVKGQAHYQIIKYYVANILPRKINHTYGLSVRCIKE